MEIVTIQEKLATIERYKRYSDIVHVCKGLGCTPYMFTVARRRQDNGYSDKEIDIVNGMYEIASARREKRIQNGLD